MNAHDVLFPDDPDPMAKYRREMEAAHGAAETFVTKTVEQARVSAPAANDVTADVMIEAVGQVISSERRDFRAALTKRDREIKLLRRELRSLRTEVELKLNLKSELAAARVKVEELRQRAPSFEAELNGLRAQIAKQQQIISRLRAEQSQLAYEQQQNSKAVTLTATQVRMTTEIGAQTREALQRLREESGFELWEPSDLPS
jgi:chromosome segregation ATPase